MNLNWHESLEDEQRKIPLFIIIIFSLSHFRTMYCTYSQTPVFFTTGHFKAYCSSCKTMQLAEDFRVHAPAPKKWLASISGHSLETKHKVTSYKPNTKIGQKIGPGPGGVWEKNYFVGRKSEKKIQGKSAKH